MTVHAADPERILEAYADSTRLTASAQLTARFQAAVVMERSSRRARFTGLLPAWLGRLAAVGAGVRLGSPFGRHLTFALRLQSLALVLLTVLALGAVGGGAGAVLVSVVHQPGQTTDLPGLPAVPAPSVLPAPSVVPVPAPSVAPPTTSSRGGPAPSLKVRVLAQRMPATRGSRADRRASQRPVVAVPFCRAADRPVVSSTRSCPF